MNIRHQQELDALLTELSETVDRTLAAREKTDDVEVRESTPLSGWLGLADSICHDPFRKRI